LWQRRFPLSFRTMDDCDSSAQGSVYRAGICSIVGLPNVGKSTLLNQLIGERLSIVTAKAQTTRQRLLGIYTDAEHQAVFVDTPGLLEPRYALHESMQAEAEKARTDADVLVYVVDVGWERSVDHARDYTAPEGVPSILCLNKTDRISPTRLRALRDDSFGPGRWQSIAATRATSGEGVGELRGAILELLPQSPPLYPVDEIAAAPVRFFVAELIRETCFEELSDELPYATAIEIESFRESDDPVYIAALIFVEKDSQKGMVIGRGGRMIKTIGREARRKVEGFLERPVYLDLRVKVLPNWRRRASRLKLLGY